MMLFRAASAFTLLLVAVPPAFSEPFGRVIGMERVDAIVREVTKSVIEQQTPIYKRALRAEGSYTDFTIKLVGDVETTLDQVAAEWRLRGLYGVFVTHVFAYVHERQRDGPIVLTSKTVESYLAHARELEVCGEIPCPSECKPCDRKCDRCP